jgi:hypothetical protein
MAQVLFYCDRLSFGPELPDMKPNLLLALLCYAALALLAWLTLSDWRFRAVVWIFLGGLAVRTWVASARHE